MKPTPCVTSVKIRGYRPFRDLTVPLGSIEVMVGANGSGKSSLFEFLRFLRDSLYDDIPPEIVSGSVGQQVFHMPGPQRFWWSVELDFGQAHPVRYQGEVAGPIGRTQVVFERAFVDMPERAYTYLDLKTGSGVIRDPESTRLQKVDSRELLLQRGNQLALATVTDPAMVTLYALRQTIRDWRFYSSFTVSAERIRRPTPLEQDPILREDAGNLSSVLHFLMTEHPEAFDELQQHLRAIVPGFVGLTVKARGAPGEVLAFWRERGPDDDLSLADVSDGTLRLICWAALCLHPSPPPLICVDEPDQGVHPRTLPVIAGLFRKASARTQVILATHASYFLTQFPVEDIAVMCKRDGEAVFSKPADSEALRAQLAEFGPAEIEAMHRSDELEALT
jgi:predicted ATPase